MKKAIYILSALLLGLVSCNLAELESIETRKDVEPTGLVAVTMKAEIPLLQAYSTRALGDFSDTPSIKDIRVAVFGTSGYPQAYALAEPVDASGNPLTQYAAVNGQTYFKVLLPVYEGEAHVHIIANGPESIPFVVGGEKMDEEKIMSTMRSESPVGAYWARIVMPDGILTQLDDNGIMQTDEEGNYLPSDGTAHLFEDLVLVRNFAEVKLSVDATVKNLTDIHWTLVNKPTTGSVAPMAGGTWLDNYKDYTYNAKTGQMVNGASIYDGFMFDDAMDYSLPTDAQITADVSDLNFMYERPFPGSEKATCILLKGKFQAEGQTADDAKYSYYRIDLMDEALEGYFPIYRNLRYQVRIHKVGNRGAATIEEAMNRDSGGNISLSTEAQKLTDISDGTSRLYVQYVEKNFTSGGKQTLWVYYVPNVTPGTEGAGDVDNTNISISIKDEGTALYKESSDAEPVIEENTVSGASVGLLDVDQVKQYTFTLNDQNETSDLVSVLRIKASNGVEGDDASTLYRDITLRVMKKMQMNLTLVPKKVDGQGSYTVLNIGLPDGLPSSMFPMEFYIEDINHTLYSTGYDGVGNNHGNAIIVPVKTDKSIVDGETNSFYFIRTVNESEYKNNHTISTEFRTNKDASATTIYVANEYFKTQSINLLNDGLYVNPTKQTVAFNVTSVDIEVECYSDDTTPAKEWTVTGGAGVTVVVLDEEGKPKMDGDVPVTTFTGSAKFRMTFSSNTSTTVSRTLTATVTSEGVDHDVTITQEPLEFSVIADTPEVNYNATTALVTVHAEEGMAWKAAITGPEGVTEYSLSETSGTGTKTLTVTLPANEANARRTFTVTATADDEDLGLAPASCSILQHGVPVALSFAASSFAMNTNNYTGVATSTNGNVRVNLTQARRSGSGNGAYIQLGRRGEQGSITVTPLNGMVITGITVTYSDENYGELDTDYNPKASVSVGSYSRSGATGTWTGSSSDAVTITNGYMSSYGVRYYPRITSIAVTYEAAN